MWLIPCSSRSARTASDSAGVAPASATAPKTTRELRWPVEPKGALPMVMNSGYAPITAG